MKLQRTLLRGKKKKKNYSPVVSDDCYCKYEADCQFKFPEGHIHYIHIIEFEKNLSVT